MGLDSLCDLMSAPARPAGDRCPVGPDPIAFLRRALALPVFALVVAGLLLVAASPAGARTRSRQPAELPVGFSRGPDLPASFVPRWNFAYGYFPPLDQVVIFGGAPTDRTLPWLDDTWVYTSTGGWVQGPASPPTLTPRGGMAMAY